MCFLYKKIYLKIKHFYLAGVLDDARLYYDIEHAAALELADGAELDSQLARNAELLADAAWIELRRQHTVNMRCLVIASYFTDAGPGRTADGTTTVLHDEDSYRCVLQSLLYILQCTALILIHMIQFV